MGFFHGPDPVKLAQKRDIAALTRILLEDEDMALRVQAAYQLGEMGDPRAVPGLAAALRDLSGHRTSLGFGIAGMMSSPVTDQAGLSLAKLRPDGILALIEAYDHPDAGSGRSLGLYAASAHPDPADVTLWIIELGSRHVDVRQCAARALGKIGDPRAIEPLGECLWEEVEHTRQVVRDALKQIGGPEAKRVLAAPRPKKKRQGED